MNRARTGRVLLLTALALALALCAVSGWSYARARGDGDLAHARSRDAALAAGRRAVARLNSLDGGRVDADLAAWLDVTTGPLREQLSAERAKSAQVLKEQGTTTRAQVTGAAVTELDDRAGTARLIATVRIESTPRSGAPVTDRKRFETGLVRTGGGWKVGSLTAVAAGTG
ncbi:hypothetical protein [Streptomyces sp. cg36]|uniref:hypothetical protein n=1 Tax=Streptomyces sp. cg36 TaxID=3238798 RepID=UPI0034E221D9